MPAFLASWLASDAVGGVWAFIKKHAALIAFALFALVFLVSILVLYDHAHKAGGDAVRVQVAQQQAATVAVARHDEQTAQKVSDAVGAQVSAKTDANHADTLAQMQEIKDELAQAKAAADAANQKLGKPIVADVVVPDSVRSKSNALVSSANGSAVYSGPAN